MDGNRLYILGFLLAVLFTACTTEPQNSNVYKSNGDRPLVDPKYTLNSDAKEVSQRKRESEEAAYFSQLMADGKRPPSEIREKFADTLRKKRELFDRDLAKERESFTNEERKKREVFLKSQQQRREQLNREKHAREVRHEFTSELDSKKSDYFSTEREKRADFESDVQERRKNFEDYSREKNNQFNEEYRNYSRRHEDLKKQVAEKIPEKSNGLTLGPQKSSSTTTEAEQLEQDLEKAKSKMGAPIESGQ